MSKEYTAGGGGLTILSAAVTLSFLHPAAAISPSLYVFRMWISQQGTVTSAQQRVQVETQVTVFPTLVSATPRTLKRSDTVASLIVGGTAGAAGTFGINASAEGAGAKTVMWEDVFNNINGYLWCATPREQVEMPPGDASGLGLFLPVAATSLSNWAVGMNYAEGM